MAQAQVVQQPTKHVVEVLTMSLRDAANYIAARDPLHADVVRLAQAMALV